MALDRAQVEHIALLARIGLTDEEVERVVVAVYHALDV